MSSFQFIRGPPKLLLFLNQHAGDERGDTPLVVLIREEALRQVIGVALKRFERVPKNKRHVVACVVVEGAALELPLPVSNIALRCLDETIDRDVTTNRCVVRGEIQEMR